VAVTPVGAEGVPAVMASDGELATPVPLVFVAVTVKV
jgi:hypothetical protein